MKRSIPFALLVAAVVSGCWKGTPSAGEQPRTVLEVDNQAGRDMTLYVLQQSGRRVRIGTAIAHTTMEFTIPARLMFGITALRFQADPVGGGAAPVTREIAVEPGATIIWRIPPAP